MESSFEEQAENGSDDGLKKLSRDEVKFLFSAKPKEPELVYLNKLKHLCRVMKKIAQRKVEVY